MESYDNACCQDHSEVVSKAYQTVKRDEISQKLFAMKMNICVVKASVQIMINSLLFKQMVN